MAHILYRPKVQMTVLFPEYTPSVMSDASELLSNAR
jgi:hypothetical protein